MNERVPDDGQAKQFPVPDESTAPAPAVALPAWSHAVAALVSMRRKDGSRPKVRQYNPRPPGVIREGSATAAVLQVMTANPLRFYRREQLIQITGFSNEAVGWALAFLVARRDIRSVADEERNSRYCRYRLAGETA